MTFLIYFAAFLIGASVFSFLTLVTYRVPEGKSFVSGRSVCESCGHTLSFFDMIPVLSWVLLLGKCRYCKSKFSPFSSICELSGGLFAAAAVAKYSLSPRAAVTFIIICVLFTSAVLSIKMTDIPVGLAAVSAMPGVICCFFAENISLYESALGVLCLFLSVLIYYIIRKENFKLGKLIFISSCGIFLGIKYALAALAIAAISGGITYLAFKNNKKRAPKIFTAVLCAVSCVLLFIL